MHAVAGQAQRRVAAGAAEASPQKIRIWDAPVRVFHWLMVLCFAGAWLTAESERWRLVHVTLGYSMAGLVVFRLVWGLIGTRHARFASFVRGPAAVAQHVRAMLRGRPEQHAGHNPTGTAGQGERRRKKGRLMVHARPRGFAPRSHACLNHQPSHNVGVVTGHLENHGGPSRWIVAG